MLCEWWSLHIFHKDQNINYRQRKHQHHLIFQILFRLFIITFYHKNVSVVTVNSTNICIMYHKTFFGRCHRKTTCGSQYLLLIFTEESLDGSKTLKCFFKLTYIYRKGPVKMKGPSKDERTIHFCKGAKTLILVFFGITQRNIMGPFKTVFIYSIKNTYFKIQNKIFAAYICACI